MTTWLTADLHLGHANICAYTGRPYDDVATMNDAIIARLNAYAVPGDELIILGDVAMGRIEESLAWIRHLNVRPVLVPGNHDRCWRGHGPKARDWRKRYYDAGFAAIVDDPEPLPIAGELVLTSHFPYRGAGDHTAVERYSEHRPIDVGGWLVHGHVHQLWRQRGRMINVGVDAWGGRPVGLHEIATLVVDGPANLGVEPWPADEPGDALAPS